MIRTVGLSKTYRVHKRPPGVAAALRSLWRRRYEEIRAVDRLTLEVSAGERVGFLGPNGAGKTTTLKMLAGLLHPTSGELEVAGYRPQSRPRAFLQSVTLVMGQKQQLLWDLPPSETFEMNRAIYGIHPDEAAATVRELSELLELDDVIARPTRTLSLGERMKCELVAALLHRPKVLFLDEPTIGLDVAMQLTVRDFIRRYNERHGATVLLTSHYMEDVLALCPRVVVIDHGRIVHDGALGELQRRVRPGKRVTFRFSRPVDREDVACFGKLIDSTGETAVLELSQETLSSAVSEALAKLPVVDLEVKDPPLEDVLRDLFDREREPAAS